MPVLPRVFQRVLLALGRDVGTCIACIIVFARHRDATAICHHDPRGCNGAAIVLLVVCCDVAGALRHVYMCA